MTVLHHQSVIVVGAMNPAIHHPAWYYATAIISEAEFKESLQKPVIATPAIAQFNCASFSVVCSPDRWQVSCDTEDGTRILALAKETFKNLFHTPMTAYGVNHDFHAETNKQLRPILLTIVRKTGLPFPSNEVGTASIIYRAEGDGCIFQTTIAESPRGPLFIYLKNNGHFQISEDPSKLFDLGPLLDEAFRRNEDRARTMLANFIDAVQRFN